MGLMSTKGLELSLLLYSVDCLRTPFPHALCHVWVLWTSCPYCSSGDAGFLWVWERKALCIHAQPLNGWLGKGAIPRIWAITVNVFAGLQAE